MAGKRKSSAWERLPEAVQNRWDSSLPPVEEVAPFDLDDQARYGEGYLALAGDRLGVWRRDHGDWQATWMPLAEMRAVELEDGVGIGRLRILDGAGVRISVRFTLRHAREIARLYRRLDRQIAHEGAVEAAEEDRDKRRDKKIRCDTCGRVIPPWADVCPACLSKRKVLSRLLDFVKPYRWRALSGLALALLGTTAGLVRPYLTRPMLDRGLGMAPGVQADYSLLLGYVVTFAALTVLTAVTQALRERLMASLGSRISRDVRNRAYAHLHRLGLAFFSRKPTGSLVTRITTDSDRIWDFVAFTVVELIIAVLTLVGVGTALFLLNWRLAAVVLIPVPVMFLLTVIFHRRLHAGFARLFHKWSVLTAVVADAISGVRVIKAFGKERDEVRRFERKNTSFYEEEVGMITLWTWFGPMVQFCSHVGSILVWLVGGYWVYRGWMTGGTLVAYVGYMWMFYGPIHMIAHMDRMFNRAASSVQRIFEILDTEPSVFSVASPRPVGHLQGHIELRHVSFSYDGVRKVLHDICLDIAPGELIGLAGPSGSGKTTLVNLICRFYDVLEGAILIDGVDSREYELEALRCRIGVVLQEPFLFHGTIAENIAYGKPNATREEIVAAARAAHAHEFIVRFPDGYDTLVGERGQTLSGGELQRISIARALLTDPRILILDEATSSVDTETERLIQQALLRLTAGRTTIAIAHRLSTLSRANRLVILDKGRIVEVGTHSELAARPNGLYARLLRMQSEMQSTVAIAG